MNPEERNNLHIPATTFLLGTAILAVAFVGLPHALGADYAEEKTLTGEADDDDFGTAVAVRGDVALVGAPEDDEGGTHAGAVFVYTRTGVTAWVLEGKLLPNNPTAHNRFGVAIAFDGTRAVVGSGGTYGGADVFRRTGSGWVQEAHLSLPAPNNFGHAVAIQGDVLAVGAPYDRVYVYERDSSSWSLTGVAVRDWDSVRFGTALAIIGKNVYATDYWDETSGDAAGAVYRFEITPQLPNPWTKKEEFSGSNTDWNDQFGRSIAVDGNRMVVGANIAGPGTWGEGAAYVFDCTAGSCDETAILSAAGDPAGDDRFGRSVAVSGDRIAVGAHVDDVYGVSSAGSAYVYSFDGTAWSQEAKLYAADRESGDRFGQSIATNGATVLVGAPLKGPLESGAAYLFDVDGDGDGLTDHREAILGTDPAAADTDGDGLSDGDEVDVHGTDPLDPDPDGDGLDDHDEVITQGTDPFDPDSDGDGLNDFDEAITYGTDPNAPDTDDDGLIDPDEIFVYFTDPLEEDTDGDHFQDGTEVGCGTDPLNVLSFPLPTCALPDAVL